MTIIDQPGDHLLSAVWRFAGLRHQQQHPIAQSWPAHATLRRIFHRRHTFYKLELTSAWYFPGFIKGHVLEVGGRTGVADSLEGGDVPFYDRYYLGGIYSLRGFKYRNVAPRRARSIHCTSVPTSPSAAILTGLVHVEYSIPIFEQDGGVGLRFALFYDIGAVDPASYSFSGNYERQLGAWACV